MIKEIKQIVSSNFAVVVEELQKMFDEGFKVVLEGEGRPYHMIMGNFIITVERMVEKKEEVADAGGAGVQLELPLEDKKDSPVVFEPIVKTDDTPPEVKEVPVKTSRAKK